jgi:hypothetical protein
MNVKIENINSFHLRKSYWADIATPEKNQGEVHTIIEVYSQQMLSREENYRIFLFHLFHSKITSYPCPKKGQVHGQNT